MNIFNKLNKNDPSEIIKFNCANEFAVNLFVKNIIKFNDIYKIINKSLNIELNSDVNNIGNIVKFQKKYVKKLQYKFNKYDI